MSLIVRVGALAVLIVCAHAQSQLIQANIKACYYFDGSYNDCNGNFPGTYVSGLSETYVAGKLGQGMLFDGTNWINLGLFSAFNLLSTSSSITAWFKIDSGAPDGDQRIVAVTDGGCCSIYMMSLRWESSALHLRCRNKEVGDVERKILSSTTLSKNQWYHGACVHDRGNALLKLYLDGTMDATTVGLSADLMDPLTKDILIGANTNSGGDPWEGILDQVIIWSVPLTSGDITALYNGGNGMSFASIIGDPVFATFAGESYHLNLRPGVFTLLSSPSMVVNALFDSLDSLPVEENIVMASVAVVTHVQGALVKVLCSIETDALFCRSFTSSSEIDQVCANIHRNVVGPNTIGILLPTVALRIKGQSVHATECTTCVTQAISHYLDVGIDVIGPNVTGSMGGLLADLDSIGFSGVESRLAEGFYEVEGDIFQLSELISEN